MRFNAVRSKRGFSLTELAIVMGVAGIVLAAIWQVTGMVRDHVAVKDANIEFSSLLFGIGNTIERSGLGVFGVLPASGCSGTGTTGEAFNDIGQDVVALDLISPKYVSWDKYPMPSWGTLHLSILLGTLSYCSGTSTTTSSVIRFYWQDPLSTARCTQLLGSNITQWLGMGLRHVWLVGDTGADQQGMASDGSDWASVSNVARWCSTGSTVTGGMEFSWPLTTR